MIKMEEKTYETRCRELECKCQEQEKVIYSLKDICEKDKKRMEEIDAAFREMQVKLVHYEGQIDAYRYCIEKMR